MIMYQDCVLLTPNSSSVDSDSSIAIAVQLIIYHNNKLQQWKSFFSVDLNYGCGPHQRSLSKCFPMMTGSP